MTLSVEELQQTGVLRELANLYSSDRRARALLAAIEYPRDRVPTTQAPDQFWYYASLEIQRRSGAEGLERLLAIAADQFPGIVALGRWLRRDSEPEQRAQSEGSYVVVSGQEDPYDLLDRVRQIAQEQRLPGEIELGIVEDARLTLYLPAVPPERALELAQRLRQSTADGSLRATVAAAAFRDYVIEQLHVEGPSQARFIVENVPASTPTRDVARAVMAEYGVDMWPKDKDDRTRPAIVDRVMPDGSTERLEPDDSLYGNGLREGDTLLVSVQSSPGGLALDESRLIDEIVGDLTTLEAQEASLRTEVQLAAHLMALGSLRRELLKDHPSNAEVLKRIEAAVQRSLRLLEEVPGTVETAERLSREAVLGLVEAPHTSAFRPRRMAPAPSDRHTTPSTSAPSYGQVRYLNGWMPETVKLGTRVPLLVRVALHPEPGGASVALSPLFRDSGVIEVVLTVHAKGFGFLSSATKVLRVTWEADSEWAVFELAASEPGVHVIRVTAFHKGVTLGTLPVQVYVDPHRETGPHVDRRQPVQPRYREPGDVTLQVRYDADRRFFRYQFIDETLGGLDEVCSDPLLRSPDDLIHDLVTAVGLVARGETGFSADQTRRWLKNHGIALWKQLVPEALMRQFWERHERIRRMFILSTGSSVPWELLYPMAPDGTDHGFLAEQFPVARLLYTGPPPSWLSGGPASFVLPEGSPLSATTEVESLRARFGSTRSLPPVSTLADLLSVLQQAKFGVLHFACHNSFQPLSATEAEILMDGRPFQPIFLSEHQDRFRSSAPLVFMNACRTSGQTPSYTRIVGWAQRFLNAGCGAFLGTQWEIVDDAASAFAESFYDSLLAGRNLGEAMMQARRGIKDEPADPTWLAYSLYGDPAAILPPRSQP